MKKSIILILVLLSINIVVSQNLVPNGSFEEYNECPDESDIGTSFLDDWFVTPNSSPSSPNYFNSCAPEGSPFDIPDNWAGYQESYDGEGYAGVYCYGWDSEQREYIEVQLESPLIEHQEYEFSMYVSVAEIFKLGINNFGALFTVDIVEGNGSTFINADPQIKVELPVSNNENWTQISGTFIAVGGEEYLTIGNFFSDEETETVVVNWTGFSGLSYFFIDSVSLIPSALAISDNQLENLINIYPNPVSEVLHIDNINTENYTLKVYSVQGQEVKLNTISSSAINVENLSSGIYFLEITTLEGFKEVRKFIKQ